MPAHCPATWYQRRPCRAWQHRPCMPVLQSGWILRLASTAETAELWPHQIEPADLPRGTSLLMLEDRSILNCASSAMHFSATLRPEMNEATPVVRPRAPAAHLGRRIAHTYDIALLLGADPLRQTGRQPALARPDVLAECLDVSSACLCMQLRASEMQMREPGVLWMRNLTAIFKPEGDTSPLPFARFASPAAAIMDEDLTVAGLSSAETIWGSMRERPSRSSAPMMDLRCILVQGLNELEGHAKAQKSRQVAQSKSAQNMLLSQR